MYKRFSRKDALLLTIVYQIVFTLSNSLPGVVLVHRELYDFISLNYLLFYCQIVFIINYLHIL